MIPAPGKVLAGSGTCDGLFLIGGTRGWKQGRRDANE
jgi:hypothetical protein